MSVKTPDVLEHWKDGIQYLHPQADEYIHPADAEALRNNHHGFDLRVSFAPWIGPISTAPVVLLYLNGGLLDPDWVIKASRDPETYAEMIRTLQGNAPLFSFRTDPDGRGWTTARLGQFGLTYGCAEEKVCFANLMPYKSRAGSLDAHMVPKLRSSRLMLEWARDTLFLEARRGEKIVVCMRSAALWGLRAGTKDGSLYAPNVTRGGFMHHGEMREEIARAVRQRVFDFPPTDEVA